ncbi:cytochrome b561 domain-containing protein At4g18260-like [Euphorbia lathyris]|uniref:cytochrome b561 domain-containing protein At4g18260-like n=1 Tax=Euphorbia lathyris TaxID=212925 RepID=UPI003313EBB1
MQKLQLLVAHLSVTFLPLVSCLLSHEDVSAHKLSGKKKADVAVHGILLWVSMGFLAPLGILIIRMSHKQEGPRRKLLFYLHFIFQVLSVVIATVAAIMSIISFENSFDNNHQRIGLVLYAAIWLQSILGFFRPLRGSKRRSSWYFVHWILGTATCVVGIINIYTGLEAYHKKISAGKTRIWGILFTAQISFMAFFYLFQEKWEYLQKQGLILPDDSDQTAINNTPMIIQTTPSDHHHQKIMVPQQCSKHNALKNLFD